MELIFIFLLVISRFGFEDMIWVMIAPVPGHRILVTFFQHLCFVFRDFEIQLCIHILYLRVMKNHFTQKGKNKKIKNG